MSKKQRLSQAIIHYKNGSKQIIKPNFEFFKGDWYSLVEAITGSNTKEGVRNYDHFELI